MDLLERDHELVVLRDAVAAATRGTGAAVAVTGDAGAGKTAVVAAAAEGASALRVVRTGCDPLRTPRPLGPLRDAAAQLGLGPLVRDADALPAEVCEELYGALRACPTVLVVEDLQWVDAATVDVLRFLVRRLGTMALALLVTYREQGIDPRHPLRRLLGDLAAQDAVTTLALRPLSPTAVATMVHGTGLASDQVHAVTGGNAFFVTEVAKEPHLPLPASVRDAVLARTTDVAPADLDVLQLVATAPDRLDDRALPALGVDLPTLRRLDATGLLVRTRGGLAFRHELARLAVESTVPPGAGPHLHAVVLAALEGVPGADPAVLTHHAVAAGDSARAAAHARRAAEQARHAGSHREAVAFLQTALDNLPAGTRPRTRAGLLHTLADELYMTSRLAEAIETVRSTFGLWAEAGDAAGLAYAHEACSIYEYYNARRRQAETHARRAAKVAAEGAAPRPYGAAVATRAFLAYLQGVVSSAEEGAGEAARVADREKDRALALRSTFVRDVLRLAEGDTTVREHLLDHAEEARAEGWDELASTIYSQLSSLDVEQRRFRSAEKVLELSLPFATERDVLICRHFQTAVRARLHLAQGRWSAAREDAERVLNEEGMPVARLWPHLVAGLVPLRRGDGDGADALEQAWRLAADIDEPARRFAVLAALAERQWLTGTEDPRVAEGVARLLAGGGSASVAWTAGELCAWASRLPGLLDPGAASALAESAGWLPEPHRLTLAGQAGAAAAWWAQAGDPYAAALAWGDSPHPANRVRGVDLLDRMGASASADRRRAELRRDGVTTVPPRPRRSTQANPGGLTNRQLEVAKLVARGFTNAEIADRLFITPKTADHHVSAVLARLGLPHRRAVVVRAQELGLA